MKKIILFVLLAVFVSFSADAADNLHVVQPKDTLWALSKAHYKNPFLWGKIWVNNTYLNDPNLIFPGEIIQYTKYGITIYKPKKRPKNLGAKKPNLKQYDGVVFYDGDNYYSDCGGGFCIWNKKDFSVGKLSHDNYNNIEIIPGNRVYIHTNKPYNASHLYIYRKMKEHSLSVSGLMSVFVPIGEIKLEKEVKKNVYRGVVVKTCGSISYDDIVSSIYPYKSLKQIKQNVLLGNVAVKLIKIRHIGLTPNIGYYMFFKAAKPFKQDFAGKTVFLDRVNKNLPENTNIGEGIVVSQYKDYISVFFDSYNSGIKEIVDETENYVLR